MADVFNYVKSRDTADRLIRKFGGALPRFIVRDVASGPDYDPVLTSTPFQTFAVRVEFTWKQLQDETVLSTDQRWLVAAGPLDALGLTDVQTSDRLSVDGVELTIVKASPLKPADVNVMYDCQIRA